MKMELPEIPLQERTPLVETLLGVIRQLLDRVQELEQTNQQLRDEIAKLKGQKPRPDIKPSRLESSAKAKTRQGRQRRGRAEPPDAEAHIDREVVLHPDNLPVGATLKAYEPFVVQELILRTETTRYLRARYDLPEGGSVLAPLPGDIVSVEGGHFGATLITYILDQYHQAQVTEPLLLEQLWEYGIKISAGQLHYILTENKEYFHQEKAEVLWAGLTASRYIGADDTGARHQGVNGYCTAIGNELFSYFESTASKSRVNFLQVLQGAQRLYVINEITLIYWERQKFLVAAVKALAEGPREFTGEQAWQSRLDELGITDERHVRMATEGTLLGGLVASGVSPQLGIVSDGADQFVLFVHGACWIHAERPLAKLVPYHEEHRAAIENIRTQIWELYQKLKAYRQKPNKAQKAKLEACFDALVDQRTGYSSIDNVLKDMRHHKVDLLRVLERPEMPLHNNAVESDIREFVKRRKISGGTRNDAGRRCRDTFASLKKTCRKLGLRFWDYLRDRIRGLGQIPRLTALIAQKAQALSAKKAAAVPA